MITLIDEAEGGSKANCHFRKVFNANYSRSWSFQQFTVNNSLDTHTHTHTHREREREAQIKIQLEQTQTKGRSIKQKLSLKNEIKAFVTNLIKKKKKKKKRKLSIVGGEQGEPKLCRKTEYPTMIRDAIIIP
jgi:hypothetical protein